MSVVVRTFFMFFLKLSRQTSVSEVVKEVGVKAGRRRDEDGRDEGDGGRDRR